MSNGIPKIKAIDTIYRGRKFRSRLEARWCVFFDWSRTEWEYEPEGYAINGIPYLPDFWLPELQIFFEVKGQPPTQEEYEKAEGLRDTTGYATAIFHGLPCENYGTIFCWSKEFPISVWGVHIEGNYKEAGLAFGSSYSSFDEFRFRLFKKTRYTSTQYGDGESGMHIAACPPADPLRKLKTEYQEPWMQEAINAAGYARFEHGENPAPPRFK